MASKDENWIQRFVVSDPIKHKHGFTLYKVTSIVFPKKYPEAATRVVVWKRYNDFKKLHSELKQRHSKLQLSDKFPPFVKAKYFSRFEEEVIEERRRAALLLLEFIAKYPSLYNTDAFVKFFENGYTVIQEDGTGELHADGEICKSKNHLTRTDLQNDIGDCSLSSEDGAISYTSDSDGVMSSAQIGPDVDTISLRKNDEVKRTINFSQIGTPVESEQESADLKKKYISKSENGLSKRLRDITTTKLRINLFNESVENPGYCLIAEQYVEEAEIKEATKNYRAAFDLYKKAISCWLSGVQSDMNHNRRNMIKEKTSMYLLRAEYIANTFLTDDIPETAENELLPLSQLWCPLSCLGNYRVLSIIGKVMLVMDESTHSLYVIKPLHKSLSPVIKTKKCILPRGGPYMVNLHAIFESDHAVYLVIQHISTGKLWDYITPYFLKESSDPLSCESRAKVNIDAPVNGEIAYSQNNMSDTTLKLDGNFKIKTAESLVENHIESCCNHSNGPLDKLVSEISPFTKLSTSSESIDMKYIKSECKHNNTIRDIHSDDLQLLGERTSCVSLQIVESNPIYGQGTTNLELKASRDDINSSTNENCDIETDILVEKAQALLKSVNETLGKSECIVPVINHSNGSNDELLSKKTCYKNNVNTEEEKCDQDTTSKNESKSCKNFKEEEKSYTDSNLIKNSVLDPEETNNNNTLDPSRLHPDLNRGVSPVSSGSEAEVQWNGWGIEGKGLNSDLVVKWASQLLVAINYLHIIGIIFRDLNPENILIGNDGNLRITYQCQFPGVEPLLDHRGEKSLFIAPECFSVHGTSCSADWWSYGVIMYNLITGRSLDYYHPAGIYEHSAIHIPEYVSSEAKSLLEKLLKYDSSQRIGSGLSGVEEIKSHPFFKGVNWEKVYKDGLFK